MTGNEEEPGSVSAPVTAATRIHRSGRATAVIAARHRVVLTLTALTGLNGLAVLGSGLITARALGPSGRGVIALVITIGATTSVAASLGINTSARLYLPKPDQGVTLGHYHGLGLCLTAAGTVLGTAVATAYAGPDHFANASTLALISAYCALSMFIWLEADGLNAFGSFNAFASINLTGSMVQVSLLVALYWGGGLTLYRALFVLDGCFVAELIACLAVLRAKGLGIRPTYNGQSYKMLLRKGVPSLGLTAALSLTFRCDSFVIAGILGPGPLGVYSVAVSGSEMLRLFPAAWGQVSFYRLASGSSSLGPLIRTRRVVIIAMAGALVVWALVTPDLVRSILGSRYVGAITPLRILLIGEVGIMAYFIDGRLLAASGRMAASGAAGVLGLLIVVPLDLIFIPKNGLKGAAGASAVAYLVTGAVAVLLLRRSPGAIRTRRRRRIALPERPS
jgi:O-antigen/teichoic acid export membrane protein